MFNAMPAYQAPKRSGERSCDRPTNDVMAASWAASNRDCPTASHASHQRHNHGLVTVDQFTERVFVPVLRGPDQNSITTARRLRDGHAL